ncbi:hypothetical protein FRC01_013211 [Tulasnella sp. 417]|nr:hypothetical protein FRC01_013211 [Tulasnella sp. 417]
MPTRPSLALRLRTLSNSIDSLRTTESVGSFRSTPSEFSAWATYPSTVRFRPRVAPQVASPLPIASPSNLHPPEQDTGEGSNQSSDGGSDQSDGEEVDQDDEGPNEQLDNEDPAATIAAIEQHRKKINSSVVVGGNIVLSARQKLTRTKMFDLEMSEAKGGMVFDYDDSDMILGLLCRIHDSEQIQSEAGPTLIVVPTEGYFEKWTSAAQAVSNGFLGNVLIYHGRKRSSAAQLDRYKLVITTYRILTGDQGLLDQGFVDRGLLQDGFRFLRVILGDVDDAAVPATPTSELENRALGFQKLSLDRGQREFYAALEERMNEVAGQHLRPYALSRGGAHKVRRMLLSLLLACCHLDLVSGRSDNTGGVRACNICKQSLDAQTRLNSCGVCLEKVMSKFPTGPSSLTNPKIREMVSIVRATERFPEGRRKTVIFCQFEDFAKIVARQLTRERIGFVKVDDQSIDAKDAAMRRIRFDPDTKVALVTVDPANIHGLNLKHISTVILMDLWWNPRLDARAFRENHEVGVNIYRLYFENTIESRILEAAPKLLYQPQLVDDCNQDIFHRLGVHSTPYNLDLLLQPTPINPRPEGEHPVARVVQRGRS